MHHILKVIESSYVTLVFQADRARIKDETLLCPITALAACHDLLLAGEGPYLKVYRQRNKDWVISEKIFDSQTIHGIVTIPQGDDSSIGLAWGGRWIRSFALQTGHVCKLQVGQKLRCTDWILDLAWNASGTSQGDLSAILLTAHNALVVIHAAYTDNSFQLRQDHATSATRSLLYTARLKWLSDRKALIVSGTAFGEIIVWSATFDSPNLHVGEGQAASIQTHFAFGAHDGSIFGIDILFDPFGVSKLPSLVIASCSDDRTLRLWDISVILDGAANRLDLETCGETKEDIPLPQSLWGRPEDEHQVLSGAPPMMGRCWAHGSRIWKVAFSPLPQNDVPKLSTEVVQLVSFGEDANCEIRSLCPQNEDLLVHIDSYTLHPRKNIWSFVMQRDQEDRTGVYTGGADGRISFVEMNNTRPSLTTCRYEQIVGALQQTNDENIHRQLSPSHNVTDTFKQYAFVSYNQVVLITRQGKLLSVALQGTSAALKSFDRWTELGTNHDMISNSIIASVPKVGAAFISSATGKVYTLSSLSMRPREVISSSSKIESMFVSVLEMDSKSMQGTKGTTNPVLGLLLVPTDADDQKNSFLAIGSWDASANDFEVHQNILLQLPPRFNVTSMSFLRDRAGILLGSRDGRVAGYSFVVETDSNLYRDKIASAEFVSQLHNEAITSILPDYDRGSSASGETHFLTTARDATLSIYALPHGVHSINPSCVHETTIPCCSWIEGAYLSQNGHLMAYGFKGGRFNVYDVNDDIEAISLECGGAHRQWAFDSSGKDEATLIWTRAGTLCLTSWQKPRFEMVKTGAHGREIKASAMTVSSDEDNLVLIATGAEDTNVRLHALRPEPANSISDYSTKPAGILRKHVTGLQHLQWSSDGRYLFTCGGAEEFFVWRVQRAPWVEFGVVCVAVMPPASPLPDLRIMEFDVIKKTALADWVGFYISMVFSDSTIRIYGVDLDENFVSSSWNLVSEQRYTSACLTQIITLPRTAPEKDQDFPFGQFSAFLTTSTDGHIAVWHAEGLHKDRSDGNYSSLKIHQNSIKCMASTNAIPTKNGEAFILVTAGDDNAIGISRLDLIGSRRTAQFSGSLILPRAHAASVTAVAILPQTSVFDMASKESVCVVSVSNDQRLRAWNITFDSSLPGPSGLEITAIDSVPTAIADAACVNVFRHGVKTHVFVCGVGMQSFKLPADLR